MNFLRGLERQLTGSMTTRRTSPVTATVPTGVRMPAPPSWWVDDEDASASSMTAMRQI